MRKNYSKRPSYDQNRVLPTDYNNADLRSLECSTVQEISPTNESYEVSWIEKLVNNIDKDDDRKQDNFESKTPFARKQCYKAEDYTRSRHGIDTGLRRNGAAVAQRTEIRRAYSGIQSNSREGKRVSSFGGTRQCEPYSSISHNRDKYSTVDLNESVGKIKRRNKNQPTTAQSSSVMVSNNSSMGSSKLSRKYQYDSYMDTEEPCDSTKKDYAYKDRAEKSKDYDVERNFRKKSINEVKLAEYDIQDPSIYQKDYGRPLRSLNNSASKYHHELNNYSDLASKKSLKQSILSSQSHNFQPNKLQVPQYRPSRSISSEGHYNSSVQPEKIKQDDAKIDDMAKRLNRVLQGINEKSKKFAPNISPLREQPNIQSRRNSCSDEYKALQRYREGNTLALNTLATNSLKTHTEDPISANNYPPFDRESILKQMQAIKDDLKNSRSINNYKDSKVKEFRVEEEDYHRAPNPSQPSKPSNYVKEKERKGQSYQQAWRDSQDTFTAKYISCDENLNRYEDMKKSLKASKHIPKDIILQESSSDFASEISPRADFLTRQFGAVFKILDARQSGELSKHNCAVEKIHEEVKYLFGGILSKIRYKNEKYNLRQFSLECEKVSRDFELSELQEIFCKASANHARTDSLISFKLHDKDAESMRYGSRNNPTNTGNDSKRSSDCSEVVKKYEFAQDIQEELEGEQANFKRKNEDEGKRLPGNKVHWIAPEEKHAEMFGAERLNQGQDSKKQPPFEKPLHTTQQNIKMKGTPEKGRESSSGQKQNNQPTPRKDFQKLCQNLNNKLNKYLTDISSTGPVLKPRGTGAGRQLEEQGSGYSPKISLQFNELHKHWNLRRT